MTHPPASLQGEPFDEFVQFVRSACIPRLRRDKDQDQSYHFNDPSTGREFDIRRSEGFDEDGAPSVRFFPCELVPNGRIFTKRNGEPVYRDDAGVANLEQDVGPNAFVSALASLGLSKENLVLVGGGYCLGAKYFDSLEACATAIANALVANERYEYFEPLSEQERVRQEALSARDSWGYWHAQKLELDRAAQEPGIFRGCFSMMGPLTAEAKHRILSYLNAPSQKSWLEIRSTAVCGNATLWSAWSTADANAPRAGNVGFPSPEELREAIRHAVAVRRAETEERLRELTPSGLRTV